MSERAVFARQARNRARVQADLRPSPIFAVIAVCDAEAKCNIMESAELREVVADLIDLLLAALGLDLLRRQRRQLRNRPATCAKQTACD